MAAVLVVARAQGGPGPSRLLVATDRPPLGASPSAPPPSPTPVPTKTATGAPDTATATPATTTAAPAPSPSASPAAPAPAPAAPAAAASSPKPPPPPKSPSIVAYQGLGAWVSLYDFAITPHPIDPAQATAAMAARGVQTLYLQTTRWNLPDAIDDPAVQAQFIQDAHAHGIKVVGWYLPGFANIDLDIANSMAVFNFRTPDGQHFDGLAPDIEDKSALGYNVAAFDAGIVAYSQRLRAAVGPGVALGAIVPDAVNNERYPPGWEGFPWHQIAKDYDVIVPMGYWSVTKPSAGCLSNQYDAGGYTRDLYTTTTSLMGATKPMLIVGGVGDCDTLAEVQAYAAAAKSVGTIGASIYSFETVENNPSAYAMWKALQSARR
jgi:hypothetical protein